MNCLIQIEALFIINKIYNSEKLNRMNGSAIIISLGQSNKIIQLWKRSLVMLNLYQILTRTRLPVLTFSYKISLPTMLLHFMSHFIKLINTLQMSMY